jgi:hypothetical protein
VLVSSSILDPPVTSTLPLGSSVALSSIRALAMGCIVAHLGVASERLIRSTVFVAGECPPMINTLDA